MRSFLVLLSFALPTTSVFAKPRSYAVWAADSAISRGQGNGYTNGVPDVSYEHGEFWWALRLLDERLGDHTYFDYIRSSASVIVADNGSIVPAYSLAAYSQDPLRTGPTFLYLYNVTKDEKWRIAADTYRSQLNGQPRTAEGQFWHKLQYFNQGWLDGIYMGEIFYAQYTSDLDSDNTTAWNDIVMQFNLMYNNTVQEEGADATYTGLMYHGYDYSHTAVWASADRGHSPEIWDRALGWYMMALVDIISIIPSSSTSSLLNILQYLAPRVAAAADVDSGVWWLVITQPGREGNYFESSGAAMYVYALLKGVRLGYIRDSDGTIVKAAIKAYNYMAENWVVDNGNGTMNWLNTVSVGSLSGNATFEYYISQTVDVNDLKGLAAFLLASLEYESLSDY